MLWPADIMETAAFLSSHLVSFLHKEHQTWWISWSGQESVGTPSVDGQTENTNERKVKVRNWTTKESWAKLVPLTGTQQTGSAREEETGLSRAAGDWTTSCRCAATSAGIGGRRRENTKKNRQNWHFRAECFVSKSISIIWCLLSHPLNSALFVCAVLQKVHHNFKNWAFENVKIYI